MLVLDQVDVHYGKIPAVKQVSLKIGENHLVALLGANGTGKTTIVNTISGFLRIKRGKIVYKDKRIDNLRADQIVDRGIVQVSQNRDLFTELSVMDNLILGAIREKDSTAVNESLERIFRYFPILENRRKQKAGSLSGGQQQMLAIGRALMSRPGLILLDEPSTGLAPLVFKSIVDIIITIRNEGIAVLWVEQNALTALSLADYFYILREGEVCCEGPIESLPENKKEFLRKYYI